jgi:hypothetical protein
MCDLNYFAANAPECPSWFERKSWTAKCVIYDDYYGNGKIELVDHIESRLEHLVRWQFTYAQAMVDYSKKADDV